MPTAKQSNCSTFPQQNKIFKKYFPPVTCCVEHIHKCLPELSTTKVKAINTFLSGLRLETIRKYSKNNYDDVRPNEDSGRLRARTACIHPISDFTSSQTRLVETILLFLAFYCPNQTEYEIVFVCRLFLFFFVCCCRVLTK
jgi:hypothetical protein